MAVGFSLSIDRECCIGSGVCVGYAASTFAQDAQAKAFVLDGPLDALDDIRNSVEACPTGAITLTIEDGGPQ